MTILEENIVVPSNLPIIIGKILEGNIIKHSNIPHIRSAVTSCRKKQICLDILCACTSHIQESVA